MRLIDADRLEEDLNEVDYIKEGEMMSEYADRLKEVIDNQPTVFPMFAGRGNGKHIITAYLAMCRALDNFGINSIEPAENLQWVLEQYQKVICELTGGFFSKLTYDADTIIAQICDRLSEEEDEQEATEEES